MQLQGFATGLVVQLNLRAGFELGHGILNHQSMIGLNAVIAVIIGEEQRDNTDIDQVAAMNPRQAFRNHGAHAEVAGGDGGMLAARTLTGIP